jgi:hypothetical protein
MTGLQNGPLTSRPAVGGTYPSALDRREFSLTRRLVKKRPGALHSAPDPRPRAVIRGLPVGLSMQTKKLALQIIIHDLLTKIDIMFSLRFNVS